MHNLPNPTRQYSTCQTRGQEIEKCLDEGLEPPYHFSIFDGLPQANFVHSIMYSYFAVVEWVGSARLRTVAMIITTTQARILMSSNISLI